jgi:hypothetical protein
MVLAAVRDVVPSVYGDPRFTMLAPGYRPDDPALPEHFTTCGYLPGYVGSKVGIATRYGLASIRDIARVSGAWVEPSSGLLPLPGDFYLLGDKTGAVLHTGVILDASGSVWQTADAGQGQGKDHQSAAFVSRTWDPIAMTLGGPAGPRTLLGWMDLDKMPGGNLVFSSSSQMPSPAPRTAGAGITLTRPPPAPSSSSLNFSGRPIWPAVLVAGGAGLFLYALTKTFNSRTPKS